MKTIITTSTMEHADYYMVVVQFKNGFADYLDDVMDFTLDIKAGIFTIEYDPDNTDSYDLRYVRHIDIKGEFVND